MVTVINNSITLVRGDTVEIPVTIRLRSKGGNMNASQKSLKEALT